MTNISEFYDVVAVDQKTNTTRMIAEGKTLRNAEAIEMMAVARRGVENEFFAVTPAGKYKDGHRWCG